jgi:hypothetical protein
MNRIMVLSLLALTYAYAATCAHGAATIPLPDGSLRQLRFSPDGQYVLAQDQAEVTVLTAKPLAVLFTIPAQNASDAHFTPDSRQVVFVSSEIQPDSRGPAFMGSPASVERWGIAERARIESTAIPALNCGTELLSPDGRVLACNDTQGTLSLIDVASGKAIFEKKKFSKWILNYDYTQPLPLPTGVMGDPGRAAMDFSPDGRFIIALPTGGDGKILAWDLRERSAVRVQGVLRDGSFYFAFVAPGRVILSSARWRAKGRMVTARLADFPSGKVLAKAKLPLRPLFRAADPNYVALRPDYAALRRFSRLVGRVDDPGPPATLVEYSTGQTIVSQTPALDAFGQYYVAEPSPGTVGLYERGKGLQAAVALGEQ